MPPNAAAEMSRIGDEYQWAVFFIFNGGVTVTVWDRADEQRLQQLVDVSASDESCMTGNKRISNCVIDFVNHLK